MRTIKRRLIGTVISMTLLAFITLLNSCSRGGVASIRYEFTSPSFSSEELETLQTTLHTRIKTFYGKRDGKSAGCDWILLKKGDPDEAKKLIYFSETREAESYVIGISGKNSFLDFTSAFEANIHNLFPGRKYETEKTSKLKKSFQFLKSEF